VTALEYRAFLVSDVAGAATEDHGRLLVVVPAHPV